MSDDTKKAMRKANKKAKAEEAEDQEQRNRRIMIILAILAILAAIVWYLNREGYLRQWFSSFSSGRSSGRFQQPRPSAPPFEGF